MTGIERLRELADGIDRNATLYCITTHAFDAEHEGMVNKPAKQLLADSADQIERETRDAVEARKDAERALCVELDAPIDEGADPLDVLRRYVGCLTDTIENLRPELGEARDRSADVSMSAYDLLPPDERDAIAWVREHGGVEEVKKKWDGCVPLASVKRMVELHKAKRDRLKAHALGLERTCRERQNHIVELNKMVADMRPRLMPEGMEWLLEVWPKWSNGEYCKFGDWWKADEYSEREPSRLTKLSIYSPEQLREWEQDEGENYGYEWNFMRPANTTYRPNKVEPPAPKVLDADGVEIRVGDTVWATNGNGPFEVTRIVNADRLRVICDDEKNGHLNVYPENITHRVPVLAADGRPLREGETVWKRANGKRLTVMHLVTSVVGLVGCSDGTEAFGTPVIFNYCPSDLTHERPERKCRDCAHWQKDPTADSMGVCWFYYHEYEGQDCYAARLADIGACEEFMPRAGALAGDA